MNRATIAAVVIACSAAIAAFAVQSQSARRTRQELEEVRSRLDRVESRQKEAAKPQAVEELRAELARVEARAVKAAEAAVPAGAKAGALPTLVTEEDIQKIVDDRVESKLQAKGPAAGGGGGGGDRKMPLHDMSKELGLDAQTQARVAEVANAAKKDIFEVVRTPRPDGTNIADDVVEAMLSGEGPRMQQVFVKLLTDKIPGTETTYLAAISGIQDRARQGLKGLLGDSVYTRYQHMNVTPDHIETGFDPFAEYVKEKGIDPAKLKK